MEPIEVNATICLQISKPIKIKLFDYTEDPVYDEDGMVTRNITYTEDALIKAALNQNVMPTESYRFLSDELVKNELKGWTIDHIDVIE